MTETNHASERPVTLLDLLRHFGPEIREQRAWVIGAMLALFAEIGLRLLEPWPLKLVFDRVLIESPKAGGLGV